MTATENGRSFELLKFPDAQPKPRPVGVSSVMERCVLGLALLEQLDPDGVEALGYQIDYTLQKLTGLTLDELVTRERR